MSDKPIIFSGPMVRKLLAARKTQTRRIIKPQPNPFRLANGLVAPVGCIHIEGDLRPRVTVGRVVTGQDLPYAVGDRLWVREAWAPLDALTHGDPGVQALVDRGFYRADRSTVDGEISRWRPSIHMPRFASRITLIVTEVRDQQLQEISRDDAMAEGVAQTWGELHADDRIGWAIKEKERAQAEDGIVSHYYDNRTSVGNYALLWDSLHGAGAWDANPWVVAISFEMSA